ncbi:MAG TPA: DUF1003 domain-containing protein [Chthonomonadaceae bacterium]|nr:DUF1003 domain-containing protein [Chthonomonadaceae bacterium]
MPIDPNDLKLSPFFAAMTDDERAALARLMTDERKAKGGLFFRRGDLARALYFVKSGSVEFTFLHPSGAPGRFEEIGPGTFFGEVGVFSRDSRRTADAVATSDTEVFVLSREQLTKYLRESPEAALHLIQGMADRLARSGGQYQRSPVPNLNKLTEEQLTSSDWLAKNVAQFAGSHAFLAVHALVYGAWVVYNLVVGERGFDPYPFHFLGVWIGLEAMTLTTFVLMNQYREDKAAKLRNDEEYKINVDADQVVNNLDARVEAIEQALKSARAGGQDAAAAAIAPPGAPVGAGPEPALAESVVDGAEPHLPESEPA